MAHLAIPKMWGYLRGIGFTFLLFFSSYFGTIFLLTPILPLVVVVPKLAKYVIDAIICLWKVYLVVSSTAIHRSR